MTNIKPAFIEYLKAQNKGKYKLTGIVEDRKNGLNYVEKRFSVHKCIIDFVLLISYVTLVIYGSNLIANPYINIQNQIGYVSGLWYYLLIELAKYICFTLLYVVLPPLFMKVLRIFFCLRWFFVGFNIAANSDEDSKAGDITYLEFYNNRVAFQTDRIFLKDGEKFTALKEQYLEQNCITDVGTLSAGLYRLFLIAFFFYYFITYFMVYHPAVGILYYAGFISVYALSHIFAFCQWKRHLKKLLRAKAE